jgi:hypothetical protein
VEFESPTRLPRALRAISREAVVTEVGPHPCAVLGSRRRKVRASSFSPGVPPTCHKQRSLAVSSGQSRSLEDDRWAGRQLPDLGWGRRPKLHGMQALAAVATAAGLDGRRAPSFCRDVGFI